MNSSIISDVESQINHLQQSIALSNSLKERLIKLESEKKDALEKCAELTAKIDRLNKAKCPNCIVLVQKLNKERKEKEKLKKDEKAKLLRTIAKTLENMDDGNTNQMTNAHQLFTELICGGLDDSPDRKEKKHITLLVDNDDSANDDNSKILAEETVIIGESEESSNDCTTKLEPRIVVAETEPVQILPPESRGGLRIIKSLVNSKFQNRKLETENVLKENLLSCAEKNGTYPVTKKLKMSPSSFNINVKSGQSCLLPLKVDTDETIVNKSSARSPSVLSEILEAVDISYNQRSSGSNKAEEERSTKWKMKPNSLVQSVNISSKNGKKLKQMTLSVTRPEKKHDISLSQGFKGGVSNHHMVHSDEEKDMILPSPDHHSKVTHCKKIGRCETMEDPDATVFNPAITSTCLPMENSFDRLPAPQKSPTYKYRRDTVRKREERMKLPGQDCDLCARYYEAAGLDKTQDMRARMNKCSRHRDKYQIRANTPPGFWDPVLPVTPEGSQEDS